VAYFVAKLLQGILSRCLFYEISFFVRECEGEDGKRGDGRDGRHVPSGSAFLYKLAFWEEIVRGGEEERRKEKVLKEKEIKEKEKKRNTF
jgi:hypothetical protein